MIYLLAWAIVYCLQMGPTTTSILADNNSPTPFMNLLTCTASGISCCNNLYSMTNVSINNKFLALLLSFVIILASCDTGGKVKLAWNETTPNVIGKFKVNFYVENSGSMNGYMCEGSEFKNVIHYYANELSNISDSVNLFFINSQIIPFHGDVDSYTLEMTPSKFDTFGGNTSSSSLDKMLGLVLGKMDQNTVSVFVSDCILAVPYGQAEKYFSIAKDNVKQVFRQAMKKQNNLGVNILCLNSHFWGKYYQYGSAPQQIDCARPYYVWIIGPQNLLGEINKNIDKTGFEGLKNEVGFSNCANIPFSIVNEHGVAESKNSLVSRTRGKKAEFIIRADLSSCLQNDSYLADVSHYKTKSPLVSIDAVRKIDNQNYTHEISVSIFENAHLDECIEILTMNMPIWVSQKNDMTGKNLNKTAGIKYIVGGVADAFKATSLHNGIKFTIK